MQIYDCSIRVSRSFVQCLGSKAAACKTKERLFLTYLTHFIVLCVYPEKYMPLRVQHPGLSGPLGTIARWLRDVYKTNLSKDCVKPFKKVVYNTQEPSFSGKREFVNM